MEADKDKPDWPVIFVLILVGLVFFVWGIWPAVIAFILGSVAIGWKKRYEGPFPTNEPEETETS